MLNKIFLDTETTGLDKYFDEILTLSIVDEYGNVLFDEMFKPERNTEWPDAMAIHKITPDMVKDCKGIREYIDIINAITNDATEVVGYNVSFDLGFLKEAGVTFDNAKYMVDPMKDFANAIGSERWKKLTFAADYIGYEWEGTAHGSLADTLATKELFQWLADRNELTILDFKTQEKVGPTPLIEFILANANYKRLSHFAGPSNSTSEMKEYFNSVVSPLSEADFEVMWKKGDKDKSSFRSLKDYINFYIGLQKEYQELFGFLKNWQCPTNSTIDNEFEKIHSWEEKYSEFSHIYVTFYRFGDQWWEETRELWDYPNVVDKYISAKESEFFDYAHFFIRGCGVKNFEQEGTKNHILKDIQSGNKKNKKIWYGVSIDQHIGGGNYYSVSPSNISQDDLIQKWSIEERMKRTSESNDNPTQGRRR